MLFHYYLLFGVTALCCVMHTQRKWKYCKLNYLYLNNVTNLIHFHFHKHFIVS
jgi:hypothetical protein